jgi:chromosome segregation ATPase
MDAFKLTSKKIAPINRQYVVLKKAFADEKKRLSDLHSDISNGFGKRQKYDAYIVKEKKNVSALKLRTTELIAALKDMKEQYQLLHPKLSALASKLR